MASNESRPLFEYCDDEEYLINWLDEATAILNDVRMHVDEIKVSTELPLTASSVYLNIRTKEQNCYCVYLYSSGLRIVGHAYDTIEKKPEAQNGEEEEVGEVFESTYALLDKISPSYVQSFGDQLCKQLLHLQQTQMQFNEEGEEEEAEQKEEEQKEEKEEEEEESKVKHIN